MTWPATAVVTGDPVTAIQLNGLPIRLVDTTLSASAASIDFTSIPQQFASLVFVTYLRADTGVGGQNVKLRMNGDTAGNYDFQTLTGNAASTLAGEFFDNTSADLGSCPDASATVNVFTGPKVVIPHYSNTVNQKSFTVLRSIKTGVATTNLSVGPNAAFWRGVAAITSLSIFPLAGSFVSGSRATLYGLP